MFGFAAFQSPLLHLGLALDHPYYILQAVKMWRMAKRAGKAAAGAGAAAASKARSAKAVAKVCL